jgi:hypothetical protein
MRSHWGHRMNNGADDLNGDDQYQSQRQSFDDRETLDVEAE